MVVTTSIPPPLNTAMDSPRQGTEFTNLGWSTFDLSDRGESGSVGSQRPLLVGCRRAYSGGGRYAWVVVVVVSVVALTFIGLFAWSRITNKSEFQLIFGIWFKQLVVELYYVYLDHTHLMT